MRNLKFDEQRILSILRQAEAGFTVEEVCRKAGISRQTFYRWRVRFSGLMPQELKRLRRLEEENARLRKLVAYLCQDGEALKGVPLRGDQGVRAVL